MPKKRAARRDTGSAKPKQLRKRLRKAEDQLQNAQTKRDRAQARVEALSIIADEIRAQLAELDKAGKKDGKARPDDAEAPAESRPSAVARPRKAITTPKAAAKPRGAARPRAAARPRVPAKGKAPAAEESAAPAAASDESSAP